MQLFDFTDRLSATLPNIDRQHVIKFNNSWLRIKQVKGVSTYLVAYRAMVFKNRKGATQYKFADPAPTCPGHPGTPWAEGWNSDREFDGIGIAVVQIDCSTTKSLARSLCVVSDQIIEGSDKHEDPRIFEMGGKFYLHTHQYFPNSLHEKPTRKYAPSRKTPSYNYSTVRDSELCVVVTELEKNEERYELGKTCFYGVNPTGYWEKNYGFFTDVGCLNAVYGVGDYSDGFAVLQSDAGRIEKTNPYENIPAKLVRPYGDVEANSSENCFVQIEKHLRSFVKDRQRSAFFSSSGPLLRTNGDRWLGVGHVKVLYKHCIIENSDDPVPNLNKLIHKFLGNGSHIVAVSPEKVLENPVSENRGKVILNNGMMYFSFLYEIEKKGRSYGLRRFSNAFIITGPNDPKMVQFATNLAPIKNGYVLSFGENDFRASVVVLSHREVTRLLKHNASSFSATDYDFELIDPC
ncbi:MAG: hypothetical protein JKX94_10450 [Sneathiella sp.]|nr:hypothetical protein [Sneathiella sp.]